MLLLFNSGSVNCGEFVEFEESDGCLYEHINYKYHYEKQTSENKIWFEYSDSDHFNVKSFETKHKILERDFESKYGNQTFQKKNTSFHYTQY